MRWRTGNNRRRKPSRICISAGHVSDWGYGLAYGGCGTYEFCRRCGVLINKWQDEEDA
jgi:hypothetical protein